MKDRELLELAAKAAGIQNYTMLGDALFVETGVAQGDSGYYWQPLVDDGHALRLAVMLEMDVMCASVRTDCGIVETIHAGTDPFDATRRAIVRAAAEIGSTK